MRLEDYAIVARKRSEWEVMDLGTLLFQCNLGAILRSSLLVGVPILMGTAVVAHFVGFLWALTFMWLMRPLYGRVTLFVLSRAVFSRHLTPREVAQALPAFLRKGWLSAILIWPWFPSRVMVEPVLLLEGLHGRDLKKRCRVLLAGGVRYSTWWGAGALAFVQCCFWFGILTLIHGFVPEGLVDLETGMLMEEASPVVAWLVLLSVALTFAVAEPLWVAAGFALYLNRRSNLEGWDVELIFRRLARRTSQGVRLSGVSILAFWFWSPLGRMFQGSTELAPDLAPERAVDRVFARDEFNTTVTRQVPTSTGENLKWLADLFEFFMWAGIIGAVIGLLYLLVRWALGVDPPPLKNKENVDQETTHVAGLDLRRESLPRDVAAEARELWAAGDAKGALSLLYRGSLVVLRDDHGLVIENGDTEGRCLGKVVRLEVLELGSYFSGLTRQWTRLAYGGETVEPDSFHALAGEYGQHFGGHR